MGHLISPSVGQASVAVLSTPAILLIAMLALMAIPVGIIGVIYLIVPFFKGVGFVFRQVFGFIGGEIGDALRIVGGLVTQIILIPLVVVNVLIGRWSAAAHFGRAIHGEFKAVGLCLYRMVIGHPARLLCLTALTEGLEKRIPAVVAAAPGADAPSPKRAGQFEGYAIVGSLPGGGSGGKLYVAEPDALKRAIFERAGQREVRQVVIKTFSLRDGSSLPQIVRESRALDAAKRLGLVLDHELTDERFYYVMRFVPGESLGLVTQRLHAAGDGEGLSAGAIGTVMGYGADLLHTLDAYHRGGLWHKDVKPDNIIVDGRSAHLVDFGLVTPLRSAMTLTTHGTEYFRDPEMVRLALKGVKVDQVDGAKFDLYAAGAVLFSVIENSFPAHGGLSQISKRCPEALRWIVRRAMTEYDKRYSSAGAMLADLECVRRAPDPFALKPIDLPSMQGADAPAQADLPVGAPLSIPDDAPIRRTPEPVAVGDGSGDFQAQPVMFKGAGSPLPPPEGAGAEQVRRRPRLRVDRWWTGGYVAEGDMPAAPGNANGAGGRGTGFFVGVGSVPQTPAAPWARRTPGVSARDQVKQAQARVRAARERARLRMSQRRHAAPGDFRSMNVGIGVAVFLFLAVCVALAMSLFTLKPRTVRLVTNDGNGNGPMVAFASGELPDDLPAEASHGTITKSPNVRTHGSHARTPREIVSGRFGGPISPGAAAAVSGQKALVISDVQPATPTIISAVDRLKTAGFSLLGNYPGSPASGEALKQQIALEAEAKQVRGLGSLESDDVSRELSQWLSGHKDLGMLVWFAKAGEDGSLHYFVVTPALDHSANDGARRAVFSTGMAALSGQLN
jgi:serine/threonine protein kinase